MKDIYTEPFLSSWPTPLSFKDMKECFRSKNVRNNVKIKVKNYLARNREDVSVVKAFWNVLFTPLGFNA